MTVPSPSESQPGADSQPSTGSQPGDAAPADIAPAETGPLAAPVLPPVIERPTPSPPLVVLRGDRWLCGLVGGVAARLAVDAVPLRVASALVFLAALFLWLPLAGALLALYVVCWLALPEEDALFADE